MELAMVSDGREGIAGPHLELDPEKFAELIIKECLNNPCIYLLQSLNEHDEAPHWKTEGWTPDLEFGWRWRDRAMGRGHLRRIKDIKSIKRIDTL